MRIRVVLGPAPVPFALTPIQASIGDLFGDLRNRQDRAQGLAWKYDAGGDGCKGVDRQGGRGEVERYRVLPGRDKVLFPGFFVPHEVLRPFTEEDVEWARENAREAGLLP